MHSIHSAFSSNTTTTINNFIKDVNTEIYTIRKHRKENVLNGKTAVYKEVFKPNQQQTKYNYKYMLKTIITLKLFIS